MPVAWRGLKLGPNTFIPLVLVETLKNTGKGPDTANSPRTTLET
jgi:hypothetical protein